MKRLNESDKSQGWVPIYRKLIDWKWFKTPKMVHIFIYLLLSANHKDCDWQSKKVKRGQLITGRKTILRDTGISEQTIRTCLSRLQKTGEIIIESTSQYSIITITNYDYYNNHELINNQQVKPQTINIKNKISNDAAKSNNHKKSTNKISSDNTDNHKYTDDKLNPLTSNQPAINQQLTTNNNDNNYNNDNKIKEENDFLKKEEDLIKERNIEEEKKGENEEKTNNERILIKDGKNIYTGNAQEYLRDFQEGKISWDDEFAMQVIHKAFKEDYPW